MRLHKRNRDSFGLNATSTADISFMLLVFFLVTTSMYVDKGLIRQLPPKESEDTVEQELLVDRENIMALTLDGEGQVSVNDSLAALHTLQGQLRTFILARQEKHLFTIDAADDCPYETYYHVQNALSNAYREAREQVAQRDYGRPVARLTTAERESLFSRLPHRVAENYHSKDSSHAD